ncbi:phytoene desaturase family protein [Mucilaginibacter ximonensis]|uniref:Phytoene desaturase family protein n=1 Tax=Mucilaginibacter ximonensis TaxID=538021 RepID=A0ABW5YAM7_9SPHI
MMQNEPKNIIVIGAGFAGLSAAAYLAKAGHSVSVIEKNAEIGGRARQIRTDKGYTFDMGPSWYWMPDVFERFFADFGYKASDFYTLTKLDPQYAIVFGKEDIMNIPSDMTGIARLFEGLEKGAADALKSFMSEAAYKYKVGIEKLVYKPGLSLLEFADIDLIRGAFRLQAFTSLSKHVQKNFKHPQLRALMEFPALFLGAIAQDTPALYSLMNYAGLALGTWYPQGGFGQVTAAMKTVAENAGAKFITNESVTGFEINNKRVSKVITNRGSYEAEGVIGAADYHHIDQQLIDAKFRNYDQAYWNKRTMAPSALIFYIGVKRKVQRLIHHNLFFDEAIETHADEIYKNPQWPSKPLFYVCCPSKTDSTVAPAGHENVFILMPLATGIKDSEALREIYFDTIMTRLETYCGEDIRSAIDYRKSYCIADFVADYNSFGGNAYGLANTLRQTAVLKPSIKNKHLQNIFFAGHLTVPGPGVPPAIISGNVAANQLLNYLKN